MIVTAINKLTNCVINGASKGFHERIKIINKNVGSEQGGVRMGRDIQVNSVD